MKNVCNRFALVLLKFYQVCLSPLKPSVCRFHPTCSEYAKQSFESLSFARAFLLTLKRLLRCHPFCEGGFDPVPLPEKKDQQ